RDLIVTGVQTCALPILGRADESGTAENPAERGIEPVRARSHYGAGTSRPSRRADVERSAVSWALLPLRDADPRCACCGCRSRSRSEERRVGKEWRTRSW